MRYNASANAIVNITLGRLMPRSFSLPEGCGILTCFGLRNLYADPRCMMILKAFRYNRAINCVERIAHQSVKY